MADKKFQSLIGTIQTHPFGMCPVVGFPKFQSLIGTIQTDEHPGPVLLSGYEFQSLIGTIQTEQVAEELNVNERSFNPS